MRFPHKLGLILLLGFVARLIYLLGAPAADPGFGVPILDGAYYVEWASAIAERRIAFWSGHPQESAGAYYLAPLYPLLLALFRSIFGGKSVATSRFKRRNRNGFSLRRNRACAWSPSSPPRPIGNS